MVIDMNYWTKVLKKLMTLVFSLFVIYISFKLMLFYLPFLIAFIISLILEPAIRFFMRKCKLKRKVSSIIVIIVVIGIILGILIWVIATLISEGSNLLDNLGTYFSNASKLIQEFINNENLKKFNIPESVITTIENVSSDFLSNVAIWLNSFLKGVLSWVSSIPTIGICLAVTFLSLYFICTDKVYMIDQIEHHFPEIWVKKIYKHLKEIITVLGKYLKAEATLVLISFIISLIGLYLLKIIGFNISYPLLYALAIGFVDALPIFGSRNSNATMGDIICL